MGALFVAYSVYGSQKGERFSDITLANIEVLSGDDNPGTGTGECHSNATYSDHAFLRCGDCIWMMNYKGTGAKGICVTK